VLRQHKRDPELRGSSYFGRDGRGVMACSPPPALRLPPRRCLDGGDGGGQPSHISHAMERSSLQNCE